MLPSGVLGVARDHTILGTNSYFSIIRQKYLADFEGVFYVGIVQPCRKTNEVCRERWLSPAWGGEECPFGGPNGRKLTEMCKNAQMSYRYDVLQLDTGADRGLLLG